MTQPPAAAIDHGVFLHWIAVIADRIGRPLAGPTQRAYHDYLSARLTTQEFAAAAERLFAEHAFNTWPGPGEFVRLARPEPPHALAAGDAFRRILTECGERQPGRPSTYAAAVVEERLGQAARIAFLAVGGSARFARCTDDEEPWLRKEFVQQYAGAAGHLAAVTELAVVAPALAHPLAAPAGRRTLGGTSPERLGSISGRVLKLSRGEGGGDE